MNIYKYISYYLCSIMCVCSFYNNNYITLFCDINVITPSIPHIPSQRRSLRQKI